MQRAIPSKRTSKPEGTPLTMQDFREAARLSAEAKSLAIAAEQSDAEARKLANEATAMEAEEKERLEQMKACEAAEVKAEESLAEAHWHLLQVTSCALKRLTNEFNLLCSLQF